MDCKPSLTCPMSHVTMWIEYIECNVIELNYCHYYYIDIYILLICIVNNVYMLRM